MATRNAKPNSVSSQDFLSVVQAAKRKGRRLLFFIYQLFPSACCGVFFAQWRDIWSPNSRKFFSFIDGNQSIVRSCAQNNFLKNQTVPDRNDSNNQTWKFIRLLACEWNTIPKRSLYQCFTRFEALFAKMRSSSCNVSLQEIANVSCTTLRRRQKKKCMKTCNKCDRFVKIPKTTPIDSNKCKKGWFYWNNECWMLTKSSMTWDE